MSDQRRKPWVLVLAAAGMMVVALVLLYVTAPKPTVLIVRVVDAETGSPVPGASVRVRPQGEQAAPIVLGDAAGTAQFENPLPSRNYLIRVQSVDYRIAYESNLPVPEGQETEVTVALVPDPGGRLFVGLDGSKVAIVDTASLLVIHTVRMPAWKQEPVDHLRLHPSADRMYATAGTDGYVLDGESGAVLAQFVVDGAVESLDLKPDGQNLFALSSPREGSVRTLSYAGGSLPETHDLAVLDAASGTTISSTHTAGPGLATLLMWWPGREMVYALEPYHRLLWRIDADPEAVLDAVPTGAFPKDGYLSTDGYHLHTYMTDWFENLQVAFFREMAPLPDLPPLPVDRAAWTLSPAGDRLYVLDDELGTLSILDLASKEPPTVLAVGSMPVALAIDDVGEWAYVVNQESQTLSVIYLPGPAVILTIPLLGQPYSLAVR